MTRILDQVLYKDEVVEHIRKIFPDTEWFSDEEDGLVRVTLADNSHYETPFRYINLCIKHNDTKHLAVVMVSRITRQILEDNENEN